MTKSISKSLVRTRRKQETKKASEQYSGN